MSKRAMLIKPCPCLYILVLGLCLAPKTFAQEQETRRYLLERVDDTAVIQLYADGFESLSLKEKLLCYHLSNAAIAGRDIFIDQKFAHSLAIRDVLEVLYLHKDAMQPETAKEIERYVKLFWLNNGIHNHLSTAKEILELSPVAFAKAIEVARRNKASLPSSEELERLYGIMTDKDSFLSCTNKSPEKGGDPVQESCNNLYQGIRVADLKDFEEKNPLNSRLVKTSTGLKEQVYRAGDGKGIPEGLYAKQLKQVILHLEKALAFAPEKTRLALEHLIRYYKTGDLQDWRAYNIAWVADTDGTVDTINGFVEVYLDARGTKGAWEALVSFVNPAKAKDIQAMAAQAQWFEPRMPWDEEFKKEKVKGIVANAITVITETGDSGPMTPIGINLPNELDIRQDYGSKSVNLSNVVEAYNQARSGRAGSTSAEFACSEAEVARAKKWAALAGDAATNLHEVIGHASGKVRAEVINPAKALGTYYSTLEEARADLVALYWISDTKLFEMGVIPHPDAALAEYEGYARNALVQLRRVPKGAKIEEDHMRNRQMIIHWLIANSDAVKVEKRDGKTYYRVTSIESFRAGCGKLLAEVMRIKGTGDYAAGKKLVDSYGTEVDPSLHAEVLERIAALGLPSSSGFVMPELRLVRDDAGKVTDVRVHYPMDLADQMLRYSGKRQ